MSHDHGMQYRAKIVAPDGQAQYSGWFNTLAELDDAMQHVQRDQENKYFCEASEVVCSECEGTREVTPKVMGTL